MTPQTITDAEWSAGRADLVPSDIPEEFDNPDHPWCETAIGLHTHSARFGLSVFVPKEGIDTREAVRHVLSAMRSDHQDKVSGCGYLLSLWFESITLPAEGMRKSNSQEAQEYRASFYGEAR